ncbi:hypothetical protein AM10699_62450 (plasmid) [Acaryochloris marina MBIC10699]|nr:hypothetical protein AM10699_62450 [Acaryochloris marina MBIC10699]
MRAIPALSINIDITVMVAGLLNPEIPSSGVTSPTSISAAAVEMATTSIGNQSRIQQVSVKAKMANIKTIGDTTNSLSFLEFATNKHVKLTLIT